MPKCFTLGALDPLTLADERVVVDTECLAHVAEADLFTALEFFCGRALMLEVAALVTLATVLLPVRSRVTHELQVEGVILLTELHQVIVRGT